MEEFDVLNMGNISNFHLDHSNFYLFMLFKLQDPLMSPKKILPIMGFMVLKTTGLNPGFQRKNRFWKICIGSWDIGKNVRNFWHFAWKAKFGYIFANISGLDAYFVKPIFALKPWVQARRFDYHKPYNRKNFFSDL